MTAMSGDDTGLPSFRAGHGRAEQWQDAVEAALRQMGDPPAGANLGFVYMTDWLAPAGRAILAYLQQVTGVEDWVGSVGIGILAAGVEYFDEPAVVVMLASLPEGEFHLFSPKSPLPVAGSLTPEGHEAAHLALVHADAHTDDLSGQLTTLSAGLSSGYLVGGVTSSRTRSLHLPAWDSRMACRAWCSPRASPSPCVSLKDVPHCVTDRPGRRCATGSRRRRAM